MKKILIYIFTAATLLGVSCKGSWLDLYPSDEVSSSEVVTDLASAKIALNGVYYILKGSRSYTSYYAAPMIYLGDIKADYMMITGSGARGAWAETLSYVSTNAPNIWGTPYKVIDWANRLIEMMEAGQAKDATPEETANIIAQCKTARALAHFDLLRNYSKFYEPESLGVPIVDKTAKWDFMPARNTVGEVFNNLIIPDLEFAIANMKGDNGNGFFNKWTAMSLLARVYQYQGNDPKALSTAKELIANSPYKLWSYEQYGNVWNTVPDSQATTEILFEFIITSTQDYIDREGLAYLYSIDGYNSFQISEKFYNLMQNSYAGDVRNELLADNDADENLKEIYRGKKIYPVKYPPNKGQSNALIANIILFRLSEAYLIAAESAFKTGDMQTAVDMMNAIVLRGNPDATPLTAGDITLDRILQERAVELFAEGHRYFDLVRNNLPIVRYTDVTTDGLWFETNEVPLSKESMSYTRDYFRAILPIPVSEMEANQNMKGQQNPGYGN